MNAHDEKYIEAPDSVIPEHGFIIEFPETDRRQAGVLVQELERAIRNAAADADQIETVQIERKKANLSSQDMGTILAIVLGAKATVAIATGIALWLRRKNQTKIRIRTRDGRDISISNVESRDAEAVLNAIKPAA